MIRRFIRFVVRLGLLSGVGLALFKVLKGRRSASELGSPSADWSPPPAPNPYLPKAPPEPELVEPVMFEEIIEKKAAVRAVPSEPEPVADAMSATDAAPATKKATPAKKAAAKKAAQPATSGPVKKVEPQKAAAQKPAPTKTAPEGAPSAKKAAPVKKAAKKPQQ